MKKFIITAVLLISALGHSQQREEGTVELAPVLGIGFANYYGGDTTSANKSITRATFGATIDYYFNEIWSLRSGLVYQMYGTEVRYQGNYGEDNLKYITIPVNANWHFGSTRNWNLNFGPSFSFLTAADSNVNGMPVNIKDAVNTFQLGLNVGIGYKIEVTENFGIGISYNNTVGLTEVAKTNEMSFKNTHSAILFSAVFKLD
jgi:hypothetical protein